ncbi:MAG: hypothetical protein QOK25_34 [Thermoleophilaceae bacterium]|jgi:hypothetical protein|nr:hypothetical protein [Thermoleophilaceae bacterium]
MAWKSSVLVVANQTADSPELIEALRERAARGDTEFTLLLPRLPGGRSEEAGSRLEAIVAAWREAGLEAHGELGDSDPVVAVKEAWDPSRFDEVVISTLATGVSKWLQVDLPHRVERIIGTAVQHVVATAAAEPSGGDAQAAPAVRKPPAAPGLERWLGAPRRRGS